MTDCSIPGCDNPAHIYYGNQVYRCREHVREPVRRHPIPLPYTYEYFKSVRDNINNTQPKDVLEKLIKKERVNLPSGNWEEHFYYESGNHFSVQHSAVEEEMDRLRRRIEREHEQWRNDREENSIYSKKRIRRDKRLMITIMSLSFTPFAYQIIKYAFGIG